MAVTVLIGHHYPDCVVALAARSTESQSRAGKLGTQFRVVSKVVPA